MKLFKMLLIALFLSLSLADDLEARRNYGFVIDGIKDIPQMDYQMEFVVKYPKNSNRLVLDCQSFINGLYYMRFSEDEWKNLWFMMLSGNQCEDIAFFGRASIEEEKPFCMFVNLDAESVDLYSDLSECQ